MISKKLTRKFYNYAVHNYGIENHVRREKIINDIQSVLRIDYAKAETMLLYMVAVNCFKETKDKLYIANSTGEFMDNSLIKYWLSNTYLF